MALGERPMKAVAAVLQVRVAARTRDFRTQVYSAEMDGARVVFAGTYFPGTRRHGGFEAISDDVGRLLESM
jgi:hypothetical protein